MLPSAPVRKILVTGFCARAKDAGWVAGADTGFVATLATHPTNTKVAIPKNVFERAITTPFSLRPSFWNYFRELKPKTDDDAAKSRQGLCPVLIA